jgi:hypothetical protein
MEIRLESKDLDLHRNNDFFLNNKFILFKCHILIALNLQSQTAISTIRQQRKG